MMIEYIYIDGKACKETKKALRNKLKQTLSNNKKCTITGRTIQKLGMCMTALADTQQYIREKYKSANLVCVPECDKQGNTWQWMLDVKVTKSKPKMASDLEILTKNLCFEEIDKGEAVVEF